MRLKNKIITGLLIIIGIVMVSCSGGPRKQIQYIVVNVTTDHVEGFKHNLRNAETGQPAFVHYPEVRFAKGDRVVMKRTRKRVTFELTSQPLY